jgi:tryptophanyl-tRNA synthetase
MARILSGMRPTGRLHLGNYTGALENWVRLQASHESYHMVADWHALTTGYEDTVRLREDTHDMVADWIAAGIDPEKSPVFVQSHVKEHAELHLLFSMIVTKARLERNPALKEQLRDLGLEENVTYGHLGYPVLQAADILMYKATAVPVGEDQVPHVELTREIARRFNMLYAPIFPEPDALLTKFARLVGLDGNRMSKSLGNTILISDTPEAIQSKVKTAYTDPLKIRKSDPGHPEGCVVFAYHGKFNDTEVAQIEVDCRSGAIGCVACKQNLATKLAASLAPLRDRRVTIADRPGYVEEALAQGEERARAVARQTMAEVRDAVRLP